MEVRKVLMFACGPHQLFAVIERGGQNLPMYDDQVFVKWQLTVPIADEGYIHEDLRFGSRVVLCGESVTWQWGERAVGRLCEHAGECRYRGGIRAAKTWAEAFADVEEYVTEEVGKLQAAWEVREQALRDAEAPSPDRFEGLVKVYVTQEFADELRDDTRVIIP